MVKECTLNPGNMPRQGLPRNSVDGITNRPDITSAVDRARNASTLPINNRKALPSSKSLL